MNCSGSFELPEKRAEDIEREYDVVADRRGFGLNFERHTPEAVELPGRPVRTGDKVHVLPERGSMPTQKNDRLWRVTAIDGVGSERMASLEAFPSADSGASLTSLVADLVVVAEFRDPIYPGLVSTGKVERGGDKPYHSVINAENFHALQTLLFTHRGKIDAIYIDPPYNTGAKDWKYNNDYVEGDDLYRHSKWLAFMERRLLLAKELLNPDDSVLIVTIDEKEYLRLGLLLEQTFPESKIQMISVQINPANVARKGAFGRSDEYAFFVMIGSAAPFRQNLGPDWVSAKGRTFTGSVRWDLLRRSGTNAQRSDRPNLFYPIYVDPETRRVVGAGTAPTLTADHSLEISPMNTIALWPIRKDGSHGNWQLGQKALLAHVEQGRVRLGGSESGYVAYYIKGGEYAKVLRGDYPVLGRKKDGSLDLGSSDEIVNLTVPGTQWRVASHDSTQYGSRLLAQFLPSTSFPFPKSLYAVEDALRFFVSEKPNATVLDFFSGSGTTQHAVMRLNHRDGGRRVSIAVTNNEVSAGEQKGLRANGLRPGDREWERMGICELVTKPRVRAAIEGVTPGGEAVKGEYKFTDEFSMADGLEENVEFFTMTYEAPLRLRANRDFARISPLLWIRAGSRGDRVESLPQGWAVTESYGVIADLDRTDRFLAAVRTSATLTHVFVITDDDSHFEAIVSELTEGVEPVRLYDSYLRNFEIDAMRGVR
ncbi:DNA methyltransferase [Herbiconiux sp. CPCC 203406]|uniref:site-specific DNA-methyltransferase n=1 Tax=Herbiconiux oxytropis TaxID=2970915 RepID=UPI00217D2F70|nr:DNA methyltransferase [Herbiconiux oxytropis]MCS5723477.1 DNA methyltransferase [Herbiconiux oxytropis]